ncbi:MAG TPA: flagellar hook-associated protein FlgL [Clostridia bacterium]|nr:flagellar hook-associated protein FlgL [Clostridia bacterium]
MRVTNGMIADTVLRNLNRNLKRLQKMQEQMSSGKTVSRPSDDPVNVARIMRLQSMVHEQEKYHDNMKNAQGYIDNAESALATVSDIMNRARELAVYGANGSMSDEDRKALAAEVDELISETIEVANTSFDGRYVFGGFKSEEPPFSRDEVDGSINYSGDSGKMEWEVARGVTIPVNIPGDELFQNGSGNVFDVLLQLKEALETSDQEALSGSVLEGVDAASNLILSQRAVLGARSNRLEVAQDRAFISNINMTEMLSKLEDVDWAEASMNFATAAAVYNAALATGAQVIQPTLLDYLR